MQNTNNAIKRREFLEFMGRGTAAGLALGLLGPLACSTLRTPESASPWKFIPLQPNAEDDLVLANGFSYQLLVKKGDPLNDGLLHFGANNDFTCFFPFSEKDPFDGMLWVNHESPEPFLISHSDRPGPGKSRKQILEEMDSVGGSLVRIRRDAHGAWKAEPRDPRNRRFTAQTPIPFAGGKKVEGKNLAIGTLANCAGGRTPWGTLLTCEENIFQYFGHWNFSATDGSARRAAKPAISYHPKEDLGWGKQFKRPATHYGWVVEIHPFTGAARKHTALGRFHHEGATCVPLADGRVAVYMGEDTNDRFLYKFLSDTPGSLETGTLYVANVEKGEWLPLVMEAHPKFRERFRHQLDLLTEASVAAEMLGATPLDRPEDIERDPVTGDMIIALTNNKPKGRRFGSLLRLSEDHRDPGSLRFSAKTWISGGQESGIACPDNLVFDSNGDLWITSDMAASDMQSGSFLPFKNNGLYFVPMKGPQAGKLLQVASAPVTAELTGPSFLPDGTLLLSVQHPGDVLADSLPATRDSHWPLGGNADPMSAVVAIRVPWLTK